MFYTTLILAIRSISRHKLRSFLTTLGIIIGVAAVVSMVTLGKATTVAAQKQISSLGSNILQIRPGQGFGRGGGGPRPPSFDESDIEALRQQVAGVKAVAAETQSSATAVYQGANWSTSIAGSNNVSFEVQPWPLASGRYFTSEEEQAGKGVCIVGNTVRTNLFRGRDPVGERIRLNGISCTVIGSLTTRGQGGFGDQDDLVILPLKQVQRRFTGDREIRMIRVGVDPAYDSQQVQNGIKQVLRERRNITGGKEDDFFIFDTAQINEAVTGVTTLLTSIVTTVAAISLVVGGIGIMNIMLVSVTERTREIGIRLAIGAVASEVLLQFLMEAVVLSCLGGLVGLLIAQGVVVGLSGLMQVDYIFDPQINLIAFGISALIGVVFGYFPAQRAAGLNPIDALRHE